MVAAQGPPRPLDGCAELSPRKGRTAEEQLRICSGQRACDETLEHECLLEVEACQKACDDGDAARCRQVSIMHERGVGMVRNPAKATATRARACELGDTHSCEPLAAETRKLRARPLPKPEPEPEPKPI